jgi:hypothetical protein
MSYLEKVLIGVVIAAAMVLQVHNALSYNPLYGFDGKAHIEYLQYLEHYGQIPPPHRGWQFYQPPLYYLLGLPVFITVGVQGVQFVNVAVFGLLILFMGRWLPRLFPKTKHLQLLLFLGTVALPVLTYLIPLITNEYMSDVLVMLSILVCLFLAKAPEKQRDTIVWVWLGIAVLGFYTKYTMLTTIPTFAVAVWLSKPDWRKFLSTGILIGTIFLLACSPILIRNMVNYHSPLALADQFYPVNPNRTKRDLAFFTNMSWITSTDIFQARNYSWIGGTWDSFWHDGYQVVTPVVSFHRKAFVLWLLGFFLTPLSIYGIVLLWRKQRKVALTLLTYLASAIIAYIGYSLHLPYPTELKAFFMGGIPIVYLVGLAAAYVYDPRTRATIFILLILQWATMLSYFWIMPWWHVAKR